MLRFPPWTIVKFCAYITSPNLLRSLTHAYSSQKVTTGICDHLGLAGCGRHLGSGGVGGASWEGRRWRSGRRRCWHGSRCRGRRRGVAHLPRSGNWASGRRGKGCLGRRDERGWGRGRGTSVGIAIHTEKQTDSMGEKLCRVKRESLIQCQALLDSAAYTDQL